MEAGKAAHRQRRPLLESRTVAYLHSLVAGSATIEVAILTEEGEKAVEAGKSDRERVKIGIEPHCGHRGTLGLLMVARLGCSPGLSALVVRLNCY